MKVLQKNIDITTLSNFKTPAVARWYFEVKNDNDVDKVSSIAQFAEEEKLKVLFVGWWTNMLFAFDYFNGIVIKNCLEWWNYDKETKLLNTSSNDVISDIAESLEKDCGQGLWHRFIWLPWSVWWAVFGNAGCFWLETENNFKSAKVLDLPTWEILDLDKQQMIFSYRTSLLKQYGWQYFLISAEFDLSTKVEKYHSDTDNLYFREHKQPKWNTCGSFFKNPVVSLEWFKRDYPEYYSDDMKIVSAWFLLEKSWLKWHRIWWAFFSPLHANFLMSDWAKSRDLLDLIHYAQKTVREKFWVKIENEVRIITN